MAQDLKTHSPTRAERAHMVMSALGLQQGKEAGEAVDLSTIPKNVIREVLRDLENALPDPKVEIPPHTPARRSAQATEAPSVFAGMEAEHPRVVAVLMQNCPHRAIADQLANWPSFFAQKVALEISRMTPSTHDRISAALKDAGI